MQVTAYLIDMHFMITRALQLNKTKDITDLIITLKRRQHIKNLWNRASYFLGLSGKVRVITQISHLWKKISHFKITRNTWNRKRAIQTYQLVINHQKWHHPAEVKVRLHLLPWKSRQLLCALFSAVIKAFFQWEDGWKFLLTKAAYHQAGALSLEWHL